MSLPAAIERFIRQGLSRDEAVAFALTLDKCLDDEGPVFVLVLIEEHPAIIYLFIYTHN